MRKNLLLMSLSSVLLVACSSVPQRSNTDATPLPVGKGAYLEGDGPDANVPANLDAVPDAVVRDEPLHRYANRPYKALGREYTPLANVGDYKEKGIASWYGKKFHGQRTSTGDNYDMYAMTAAHPVLPIPSYARVTNVATGKSVIVRVNDRGPFLHDRIIDLSYVAAHKLGLIGTGSGEVTVESLTTNSPSSAVAVSTLSAPEAVVTTPLPDVVAPTAPSVEKKVVTPPVTQAAATATGNTYLQLGAFKTKSSAQQFMQKMHSKLGKSSEQFSLQEQNGLFRVRLGAYANADLARASAEKLQMRLGVKPFVSLK